MLMTENLSEKAASREGGDGAESSPLAALPDATSEGQSRLYSPCCRTPILIPHPANGQLVPARGTDLNIRTPLPMSCSGCGRTFEIKETFA
jgi:hypothetical protein